MEDENEFKDLQKNLRFFFSSTIMSIVEAAFLAFWVYIQWLVDIKVFTTYQLSGVDSWVLKTFQVLFAITTLAPVIIFFYGDISIMIIRTKKRIDDEAGIPKTGKGVKK